MIKRNVGATKQKSDQYRRSSRYFRRQNRAASKAVCVPSILGPNTALLAALAYGPLRRANLQMRFHERILQSVEKLDAAGLTTSWQLPNLKVGTGIKIGKGRARRGMCAALNPAFPLGPQVQKLAQRIAEAYEMAIDSDVSSEEAALLPHDEQTDVYRLCGSAIKTKTLLALELLRGRTRTHTLYHSVPDESIDCVKGIVRSLMRLGIVTIGDGDVRFADTPWRRELRALLRALLAYDPAFAEASRLKLAQKRRLTKGYHRHGLFGKNAAQRYLCELAVHGPLSRSKIAGRAKLSGDWQLIERFTKMGILTRTGASRGSKYALNAAHPLYKPLRRYLLQLQGLPVTLTSQEEVATPGPSFSVDTLFGTQLQLDVLVMVYLSGSEGIDGADLRRLLPQHNQRNMRDKLWDFCAWEIAIEDEMDFGMIRYRLNAEFPQYEALTALLDAVGEMYPNYQRAYALREELWPERRATRERNRDARNRLPSKAST
jgi:hypothetical protein